MKVAKGYKQTDIGVIPEEWEVQKLKRVCKLINGRGFKPHEWKKEGLPIIRIQNLNGSEDYNYFKGTFNNKILVEEGQLLFAWSGSRGTSFGPHIWNGQKALLNYHTWKVNVVEQKIDKEFFLHLLKQLTKQIEEKAHGASALVHTQKGEMENFEFPFPTSKAEQIEIASKLTDADTLILTLEKLIAKKQNIKQGTMRLLLTGKKRLKGFKGDWEIKKLGQIGDTYGGLSGKAKQDFENGKRPYIPFMNIMSNPIIDTKYFDYVNIEFNERQNKAVKGDLFFNGSSETPEEVGMCSVLQQEVPDLYLNSFCFGFRLKKELQNDGLFLTYYFRSKEGRKLFFSSAQGATRYNLSKSNFLKIEIPLPKPNEQMAIAEVVSDMDTELEELRKQLSKYKLVKQGMMQNLLTGKVRLVNLSGNSG